MSRSDFHFEFYNENVSYPLEALEAEAEKRLRALAEGRRDLIGAAVAVEELSQEETPHFYRARVAAYIKPEQLVAVEKADNLEVALHGALEAIERQVHERRERLGEPWAQTDQVNSGGVYELLPEEIYDAYSGLFQDKNLLDLDRTEIATTIMTKKGLDQDAAYYAADHLLVAVEEQDETGL